MIKELFDQLIRTESGWTGLVLRLTLGIVIFPHAVQKMFGWFNGPGLACEMKFMTKTAGLPPIVAILAIIIECTGMLMLLTGFGSRIAAIGLFCLFIGIISTIHYKNGFFMNWFGKLPAGQEGFEFHILVLGLCIAIFLEGSGNFSIDSYIMKLY